MISQVYTESDGYVYTLNFTYDENGNIVKREDSSNDGYASTIETTWKLVYIPKDFADWEWDDFVYDTLKI